MASFLEIQNMFDRLVKLDIFDEYVSVSVLEYLEEVNLNNPIPAEEAEMIINDAGEIRSRHQAYGFSEQVFMVYSDLIRRMGLTLENEGDMYGLAASDGTWIADTTYPRIYPLLNYDVPAEKLVNEVTFGGETLLTVRDTTATEADVVAGKVFTMANGVKGTGTLTNSGGGGMNWKGEYQSGTTYPKDSVVAYEETIYIALQETAQTPTNSSWQKMLPPDTGICVSIPGTTITLEPSQTSYDNSPPVMMSGLSRQPRTGDLLLSNNLNLFQITAVTGYTLSLRFLNNLGSGLPTPTAADAGKVLRVKADGSGYEMVTLSIPTITTSTDPDGITDIVINT